MKKSIAIIDCAVKDPAIACFNRLQREINHLLSYHNFPSQGVRSLKLEEGFAGLVILGSHSNVGDGSLWHEPLTKFVLEELKVGTPVLGICFGHQLLCHAFGSTLEKNVSNKMLEGLREVQLEQDLFTLEGHSFSLFTAHNYQIKCLGDELRVIGTAKDSPFEIVTHKHLPYWSCQSHPEGSEFFLENEISFSLNKEDIKRGLDDGLNFIKSFIDSNCAQN